MSDELDRLDDEQMADDMQRAEVAPNVYHFPRVHNEDEARKVEAWITEHVLPPSSRGDAGGTGRE